MHNLLNNYPIYFPKNKSQYIYRLNEFVKQDNYQLPIIVNITTLNNPDRSLKRILSKNTQLLLISLTQLNSILAEYHWTKDDRHHHLHRNRLTIKQGGKMASRASIKFRNMKKFSKSLASLTTATTNHLNVLHRNENDDDDDDNNDNTVHQRNLVKNLNEKHLTSSSMLLCRIPIGYRRFFELLNESGHAAEPCHRLTDLIPATADNQDLEDRNEKWPHGFYLRSPCQAFTQKILAESNSTTSNDSCYGSSSDLESQRNSIILNDSVHMLPAGEMLLILGECLARHVRTSDKSPAISPSVVSSPVNWFRDKSRGLFSRKSRPSATSENTVLNEFVRNKSNSTKLEPYLKCQNEQGDIFFISLLENGLFSPLNFQNYHSKSDLGLARIDFTEVFQLKNLVSSFRLPISVRHLDGAIVFDNSYLPATIHRHEPPTKLRLHMTYAEDVVFVCPINIQTSKLSKNSSSCLVFPLAINTDIEIQACVNMNEIYRTQEFAELMDMCTELINQYLNDISLIHSPLQLPTNANRRRPPLYKKRSQSESFLDYSDDDSKSKFSLLHKQFNSTDDSLSPAPSPLRYRDSVETLRQKGSAGRDQKQMRNASSYSKLKIDKQNRHSYCGHPSEDEIYDDVDKIYDYIRSGDTTGELKKIEAREINGYHPHVIIIPNETNRRSDCDRSLRTIITHRFVPQIVDWKNDDDDDFEYHSCRNVDDDQAHALYLQSKQRTQPNVQNAVDSKSITKMQKCSKH